MCGKERKERLGNKIWIVQFVVILLALTLVEGSLAASAVFLNDSGRSARAFRITFSEPVEITNFGDELEYQWPKGKAKAFTFTGLSIDEWFTCWVSWEPDLATVVEKEWLESGKLVSLDEKDGEGFQWPDLDTVVFATDQAASTCDPHWLYNIASSRPAFNVYESLVRWPYGTVDTDERDLLYSLDPEDLLPMLATSWSVSEDGLTYRFTIRQGVKFHKGGELTPEDVEYSFERALLQDRGGGPVWMLHEPLTGYHSLRKVAGAVLGRYVSDLHTLTPEEQAKIYNKCIDPAVEVEDGAVVFHLAQVYAPFMSILAHGSTCGVILDKEWCIDEASCWDGDPDTWAKWWNPSVEDSGLYNIANGTGPFQLSWWGKGEEIVLERFENYWRKLAKLQYAVIKQVPESDIRLSVFKSGAVDLYGVSPGNWNEVEGAEGIVVQDVLPGPVGILPVAFFVSPVETEDNQLLGEGPWDGFAMPPDLFSDIKVRKAFCLAFDYDRFIEEAYSGNGYRTHGPIPQAFEWAYHPDEDLLWEYDLEQAIRLMREVRGGELWDKGFDLPIVVLNKDDPRIAARFLKTGIEKMNPRFKVRLVPWDMYAPYLSTGRAPLFVAGWWADYADPHNCAVAFVSSRGLFPQWQGEYMNEGVFRPHFNSLVDAGAHTTDQAERAEIYHEISRLVHEYAVDIWLPQPKGVRYMRDSIQGYPFNPILIDPYFYPMYKEHK